MGTDVADGAEVREAQAFGGQPVEVRRLDLAVEGEMSTLTPSFTNLTQDSSLTPEPFFALVLLGLELPQGQLFRSVQTLAQVLKRTLASPTLPSVDGNCRKEDHDRHEDDAYCPADQCFHHRCTFPLTPTHVEMTATLG